MLVVTRSRVVLVAYRNSTSDGEKAKFMGESQKNIPYCNKRDGETCWYYHTRFRHIKRRI